MPDGREAPNLSCKHYNARKDFTFAKKPVENKKKKTTPIYST